MDGANRLLRVMRDQGHSVSLSVFHSLISGHSQKGDLAKAKKIVPVMKQWDVLPTMETYLTLCRGFAKKGERL